MMNKKLSFQNQDDIHKKVQALLSTRNSLWGDEANLVEQHLDVCDECREFEMLLMELANDRWNPYQAQYLSIQKREAVLKSIESNRRPSNLPIGRPGKSWVQVLSVFVVFLLAGGVSLAINSPQDSLITTLNTTSEVQRDYDGWEIGVAFDLPESWEHTQFNFDGFDQTFTAVAIAERKELLYRWDRTVLKPGESRGIVAVQNPIHERSGTPEEQLKSFPLRTLGKQADGLTITTIAGQRAIYYEGEPAYNHAIVDKISSATFFVGDKVVQVHIETAANENGSFPNIREAIEAIIDSIIPIDYSGWKMWEHPTLDLSFAYPSSAVISSSIENPTISITGIAPHLNYEWKFESTNLSFTDFSTADEYYDQIASQIASSRGFSDIQNTAPSNSRYSRKLYKVTNTDGKQLSLLISVVARWSDTPMVSILIIEEEGLDEIEPIFEKVVRSGRTKGLPLFDTGERVSIPSVQNFNRHNFSYNKEMIIDPAEVEISIQELITKGDGTQLEFFIQSSPTLQSKINENQFSINIWGRRATLSDQHSSFVKDLSGTYYNGDAGEYDSANSVLFDSALNLVAGNEFTLAANTVFFSVPGNQDLSLNFAGRSWGDRWEIDESIYFNGLGLNLNEVWLDEEASQLNLFATLDSSNIPYDIAEFKSSGNSQIKFIANGNNVSLSYPMAILPSGEFSFYLIGNIEYEDTLHLVFTLDESGNVFPLNEN